MRADLEVITNAWVSMEVNVAASATGFEAGEPIHQITTHSSGAASANTWILAASDTPVIGTDRFGGIAMKASLPRGGTVTAQKTQVARPIPNIGRIRGKAETKANVDTAAELLAIIGDYTLIDYSATGASDGGQLYTIKDTASADTSGLEIIQGNTAKGLLEVTVDVRAYRFDVS